MYIADKYWNNYIGDTDDSLTLLAYLADKGQAELSLGEIFSDIGLDKLNGDFRQSEEPLTAVLTHMESEYGEPCVDFCYAIDLIGDLAALLLECKVNGSVDLTELSGGDVEPDIPELRITATPEEHKLLNRALLDFASNPLAYDISEMLAEEEVRAMAAVYGELREELYGSEN